MVKLYHELIYTLEGTFTARIIVNFFEIFYSVVPYLLASVFIAVVIGRYFPRKSILVKSRYEIVSIVVASFVGLLSPLPTYVAVPVGISFVSLGIPFSAVIAFAIASPLMNPSIFYLTAGLLGLEIAIARTVSAFLIALIGGILVKVFFKSFQFRFKEEFKPRSSAKRPLWYEFWRHLRFVGKYFLIAIFISSTIKAVVPAEFIEKVLGVQSSANILIAIALGAPLYNCGGAAIPVIQLLMEMGMSKGPVLAFFISGPATKLATLYVYKTTMGNKITAYYLILVSTSAFLFGFIYSKL